MILPRWLQQLHLVVAWVPAPSPSPNRHWLQFRRILRAALFTSLYSHLQRNVKKNLNNIGLHTTRFISEWKRKKNLSLSVNMCRFTYLLMICWWIESLYRLRSSSLYIVSLMNRKYSHTLSICWPTHFYLKNFNENAMIYVMSQYLFMEICLWNFIVLIIFFSFFECSIAYWKV